jgi:3-carboxy-cis,cis-muconate cycloisomerase
MPVRLMESLATTEPLAAVFADESVLEAMLRFEIALARSQARLGIIPAAAVKAIAAAASVNNFDPAALASETLRAGTPAIPLVQALTRQVRKRNTAAAGFVHWGATSQDVADTALILLLKRVQAILESDLDRVEAALRRLADRHRRTVMLSRTLLQAAPPTTFGFKTAGWLGSIHRSRARLDAAFQESLVLEFGGAAGTLAALGKKGTVLGKTLARELGLGFPDAPWHAHRDRLAALLCACGVLTGALGKMARDLSLLMQTEVGETAEASAQGRGGSSTMPHKRNPIGCALTLASAGRLPGLVSSFLSGMPQEHERGLGGWHAEWPVVAQAVQATGLAVASMAEVAEGLTVDAARMRANIQATRGVVFAERAMMLAGAKLGRDSAHRVLEEAANRSREEKRSLREVLAELPEIEDALGREALAGLEAPEQYLGSADEFQRRLLASAKKKSRRGSSHGKE